MAVGSAFQAILRKLRAHYGLGELSKRASVEAIEGRVLMSISSASIALLTDHPIEGDTAYFGLSATTDGSLTGWTVDWGDGSDPTTYSADATVVSHTYATLGPYTITASVSDENDGGGGSYSGTDSGSYSGSSSSTYNTGLGLSIFAHQTLDSLTVEDLPSGDSATADSDDVSDSSAYTVSLTDIVDENDNEFVDLSLSGEVSPDSAPSDPILYSAFDMNSAFVQTGSMSASGTEITLPGGNASYIIDAGVDANGDGILEGGEVTREIAAPVAARFNIACSPNPFEINMTASETFREVEISSANANDVHKLVSLHIDRQRLVAGALTTRFSLTQESPQANGQIKVHIDVGGTAPTTPTTYEIMLSATDDNGAKSNDVKIKVTLK